MTPIARLQAAFPESAGWECAVREGVGGRFIARVYHHEKNGGVSTIRFRFLRETEDAAVDAVIAAYDAMVEGSARVKELRAGLDELSAEFVAIGHLKHDLHAQLEEARAQLAAEREHRARKNDATVKP